MSLKFYLNRSGEILQPYLLDINLSRLTLQEEAALELFKTQADSDRVQAEIFTFFRGVEANKPSVEPIPEPKTVVRICSGWSLNAL